jgi:diguanylate cyclase (GGDEF)-like protein
MHNLIPYSSFVEFAQNSLQVLNTYHPFGFWMVFRVNQQDDDLITLASEHYRKELEFKLDSGDSVTWSKTMCKKMMLNKGPNIAHDISLVDSYKDMAMVKKYNIASYIGIPLYTANGDMFGALCAIDTETKPEDIYAYESTLHTMSRSLMTVYEQEKELLQTHRLYEKTRLLAAKDDLTGLYNKRGWEWTLEKEEMRCKNFGTPCAIIIMEMDNLKHFSSELGVDAGNRYLLRLTDVLNQGRAENDVVARLDVDQFALFLYDSQTEDTLAVIEQIRKAFVKNNFLISIGVCQRDPRHDFKTMIDVARQQMSKEKLNKLAKSNIS